MPNLAPIQTEQQLEDLLSEPTPGAIAAMGQIEGDLLVLGAGGKMGPTLTRMAHRASQAAGRARQVIAVSRFSDTRQEAALQAHGVRTIRCDLMDREGLAQLPDAANILFMVAFKFGSSRDRSQAWAINCLLPALVCERFPRSRIVAFSTGNVYDFTPADSGGASESLQPQPVGEYAMSCLGRERMFEYFSTLKGIPISLLRLNYAGELRYGVMVDLAMRVWTGRTVDLSMGHFNTLWQGDANAMALQTFPHAVSPPFIVNLSGAETLGVRSVCEEFGQRFGKPVHFVGRESDTALLSDTRMSHKLFGSPRVDATQMIEWVANWISRGGGTLDKPTRFEVRDGSF